MFCWPRCGQVPCLCSFMAALHWTVREGGGSAGSELGSSLPEGQLGLLMEWSCSSERTREGYKLPWAFLRSRKSPAVFLKHSVNSKARPDKIQGGAGEGYFKGRFCKECVSFSSNRVSWTEMLKVQPLKRLYVARVCVPEPLPWQVWSAVQQSEAWECPLRQPVSP